MATQTAAKQAAAALSKPVRASPALQALLGLAPGVTTTTRADALKGVWAHIKAKGLQQAAAKTVIAPDAALAGVFGDAPVKMTQVMGLLSKHLTAIPDAAASRPRAQSPCAPRRRRRRRSPRCRRRRPRRPRR